MLAPVPASTAARLIDSGGKLLKAPRDCAVVPARPRLSAVPRSTASRRAVSVSACLVSARAVVEIVPLCSLATPPRANVPVFGPYAIQCSRHCTGATLPTRNK